MRGVKLFRILRIQVSLNYIWFTVFGPVGMITRRDILNLLEIKTDLIE